MAMPGQLLHYAVSIPLDQPPGLYWYHTHPQAGLDLQRWALGSEAWQRALVHIAVSSPENEIDCSGGQSLELGIAFMLTDPRQPTV
jgi:hypothetical protein